MGTTECSQCLSEVDNNDGDTNSKLTLVCRYLFVCKRKQKEPSSSDGTFLGLRTLHGDPSCSDVPLFGLRTLYYLVGPMHIHVCTEYCCSNVRIIALISVSEMSEFCEMLYTFQQLFKSL